MIARRSMHTIGLCAIVLVTASRAGLAQLRPRFLVPGDTVQWGPTIPTLTPTLRWIPIPGVAAYYIGVMRVPVTPSQSTGYALQSLVNGNSFVIPTGKLESGRVYMWWVQSANDATQKSANYYFTTQSGPAPPPAPVPNTYLRTRIGGPGGSAAPGPMQSSRMVNFQWDVENPQLATRFEILLQQRPGSNGQACNNERIAVPAVPGATRYSRTEYVPDKCYQDPNFFWMVFGYNRNGQMEGPVNTTPVGLFFRVPPETKVVLSAVGPGSPNRPGPVLPSRDLNAEWSVNQAEPVMRFSVFIKQYSADWKRVCDVGEFGVPAVPGQTRYSVRMMARDAGCGSNNFAWMVRYILKSNDVSIVYLTNYFTIR